MFVGKGAGAGDPEGGEDGKGGKEQTTRETGSGTFISTSWPGGHPES